MDEKQPRWADSVTVGLAVIDKGRIKTADLKTAFKAAVAIEKQITKYEKFVDMGTVLNDMGLTELPQRQLLYDFLFKAYQKNKGVKDKTRQEEVALVQKTVKSITPIFPWYEKAVRRRRSLGLP